MKDFKPANRSVIDSLVKTRALPAGLKPLEMEWLHDAVDEAAVEKVYREAINSIRGILASDPNIDLTKEAQRQHDLLLQYQAIAEPYSRGVDEGVEFPEGGIELSDKPLKQDPPMTPEELADLKDRYRRANHNSDPRPQPTKRDPLAPRTGNSID